MGPGLACRLELLWMKPSQFWARQFKVAAPIIALLCKCFPWETTSGFMEVALRSAILHTWTLSFRIPTAKTLMPAMGCHQLRGLLQDSMRFTQWRIAHRRVSFLRCLNTKNVISFTGKVKNRSTIYPSGNGVTSFRTVIT